MQAVVLTIHLLLALALILVVLVQRSEGGGLGIGGGGGGVMTSRGAATALSKLTWALGTAFVITSLTLTVLAARDSGAGSVIDRIDPSAPIGAPASGPAVPGLEGDLLPPVQSGGPATPPPVQ
jgi:preprotein translocase subunit SecG